MCQNNGMYLVIGYDDAGDWYYEADKFVTCDNPDHWTPNRHVCGSFSTYEAAKAEAKRLNGE